MVGFRDQYPVVDQRIEGVFSKYRELGYYIENANLDLFADDRFTYAVIISLDANKVHYYDNRAIYKVYKKQGCLIQELSEDEIPQALKDLYGSAAL